MVYRNSGDDAAPVAYLATPCGRHARKQCGNGWKLDHAVHIPDICIAVGMAGLPLLCLAPRGELDIARSAHDSVCGHVFLDANTIRDAHWCIRIT